MAAPPASCRVEEPSVLCCALSHLSPHLPRSQQVMKSRLFWLLSDFWLTSQGFAGWQRCWQCCESQLALTHRVPAPRGCMSLSPHLPAGLPGPQGRDVQPFLCQAETLGSDSSACVIISSAWPVNRDMVPENALRASGNVFGLHPWMEAAGQEIIRTKDVPDLGKGKERRPLSHFIHCQKLDFWMTPLFPQA